MPRPACVSKPQSGAAVTRGVADGVRDALDAVGDHVGVFDDVRLHVHDARNQLPVVGQRVLGEDAVLVFVAGVGFLDGEPAHVEFVQLREHGFERRVAVVGALVAPPTGVHANLVVGDVPRRLVERVHVQADDWLELLDGAVAEAAVARGQQVGASRWRTAPVSAMASYSSRSASPTA